MKGLGAIALAIGFVMIAYRLIAQIKAQQSELAQALSLLHLLHRQISQFETPLPQIYALAKKEGLYDEAFWLAVSQNGMAKTLTERQRRLCMPAEVENTLSDFCAQLGKSSGAMQEAACRDAISALEIQRAQMAQEAPKKKKLCLTMSICVGASLLILLL